MIELSEVEKTYYTEGVATHVLKRIDLKIEEGEFVAIMGPSGAGKSTLMNILGLLDSPTGGRYLLKGQDVTQLPDKLLARLRNQRIGFVFQLFHLLDRLSVLDNVLLPLLYSENYPADAKERGLRLLARVGLSDRVHYKPNALSGGQQQRVAIARALITNPDLILADEPTGNLDSAMGAEILGLLRELHEEGRTVVLVTHDPKVAAYAKRVVELVDGRVVSDRFVS